TPAGRGVTIGITYSIATVRSAMPAIRRSSASASVVGACIAVRAVRPGGVLFDWPVSPALGHAQRVRRVTGKGQLAADAANAGPPKLDDDARLGVGDDQADLAFGKLL